MIKKFNSLSLLTFCALTLLACSNNETETKEVQTTEKKEQDDARFTTPVKGDMLVDASISEASILIPWIATDQASHAISSQVYDTLLTYDKNLSLIGKLAQSWDVSDDNLSITFHLRDDVQWSDGQKFTSADVLKSYQVITAPTTRTPYAGDFELVEKVETPDALTFKVTYKEPFSPALSSWATFSILPKHLLDKAEDIHTSDLATKPMGTGPYMLEKWKNGEDVVMQANPTHFKHEPYITKLRTRLITDADAQFLELKSGRVDMMSLKPIQFTRMTNTAKFNEKFQKVKYLGNGYTFMGFKLDHPLFKDKKVRQALSYATPREELIQGALLGEGLPIASIFKPGTWANNEKLTPYPYDMEKAKALLQEAGFEDTNGNGIIDKEIDGKRQEFEFTVVTNQGNDTRKATAEIMQQAFKKIGIKMDIQVQEWSTFIENTINKRQFESFILGWSLSVEPDPYDIWHSSKTGEREFNIIGFNNTEADKLIEKARRTFDQAERKAYLDRFQEILHDEQPYLFLYAPYTLLAISKRVQNIEPAPAGIGYNQEDWFVPKHLQVYKESMTQ